MVSGVRPAPSCGRIEIDPCWCRTSTLFMSPYILEGNIDSINVWSSKRQRWQRSMKVDKSHRTISFHRVLVASRLPLWSETWAARRTLISSKTLISRLDLRFSMGPPSTFSQCWAVEGDKTELGARGQCSGRCQFWGLACQESVNGVWSRIPTSQAHLLPLIFALPNCWVICR